MPPSVAHSWSAALNAICKPFFAFRLPSNCTFISNAHRVGPRRVILKTRLEGPLSNFKIDKILIPPPALSFDPPVADNENVSVLMSAATSAGSPFPQANVLHQATLKVKPETNQLTLVYKDAFAQVLKTERVMIK